MDWSTYYPAFVERDETQREIDAEHQTRSDSATKKPTKRVEIADIGCGFGGLLFALAPRFPETLILGRQSLKCFLYTPV